MLEEIADWVVLAPVVASVVLAVLAALWLNGRRPAPVKVPATRRSARPT